MSLRKRHRLYSSCEPAKPTSHAIIVHQALRRHTQTNDYERCADYNTEQSLFIAIFTDPLYITV